MALPQATAPKSQNTVMVGCKLPNGLNLEIFEEGKTDDDKKIFRRTGDRVLVRGSNSSNVVGGFGLTRVDADFWEKWRAQHASFPALKAGLIFAEERQDRAADHALDAKEAKTGLEPIDPNKPPKGIEAVPEKEVKARAAMAA
jgi:hypothetical protein